MIKKIGVALFVLISLPNFLVAERESSGIRLTLMDCYHRALEKSENIRIQAQNIVQAELEKQRALGTVLPNLKFNFSQTYQDTSGVEGGSGGVGGTFTRSERPESKFVLKQELFSGFKEFAALSASKSLSQKETFLLKNVAKLLFREIAQSFYQITQLKKDLENVQTILIFTQERIKELQSRVQLGKSRESEMLSVESQLFMSRSEEEKIKGELEIARENLSTLLGMETDSFQIAEDPDSNDPVELMETYLGKVGQRTEIRAQSEEIQARRQNVKIARAQFFPHANFTGNYYTKRVGFQEPIDWDVLLNLDIPIFQGRIAQSALRRSSSELKQSELELLRLKRNAESEVRKKFLLLKSALQQHKTLVDAYKKSEESYRVQTGEYRLGLVNNLEVLQALNQLQETKRNLDRIFVQTKLYRIDLKIAVEELPQ
ncbi:MAG: TolC family protein [Elusimicrobia bacterium]|nr:TolC family protein [Elusimicrobiota bacterium]